MKISRRSFVPMLGTALIGASCLSLESTSGNPINDILLPKRLLPGDTIGICAPAGPIRHGKEIDEFVEVIRDLGFEVKLGKNVAKQYGYFSANDKERAEEFMSLIEDDSVSGIFTIRGGWGCARLLEHLNFEVIKDHPKVILGFSDMTTLLNAIAAKTGLVTFHGPNGNSTWNDYSVGYFKSTLVDAVEVKYSNTPVMDLPIKTISPGIAEGKLFGGNLSVLSGLTGSDYLPDWENAILFIEDVNEEPYRIDRMLTQLKLAGIFDAVNGVVLGGFRKCVAEEPDRSFTLEEVFEQHFSKLNKPVYSGAQIGHLRNKYTLPVGFPIQMDADNGTIRLLDKAVI